MASREAESFYVDPEDLRRLVDERHHWLTMTDARAITGAHPRRLRRAVDEGLISARTTLNRRRLELARPDVEALAASLRAEQDDRARSRAQNRARRIAEQEHSRKRQALATAPDDGRLWLSIREVAEQLGVTRAAVSRMVVEDRIPHTRAGHRVWIAADHLDIYLRSRAFTRAARAADRRDQTIHR